MFQILFIMSGQFYQYFQYKQITKAGGWVCLIVSSLWSRNRHFLRVVWSDLSTFTLYWSCFLISPPCPTCSSWGSLWQSWPWVPHAGCCEGGKHWEVVADTLSEFSHRMLVSGYHAKFRLEVIKAAVIGYERKVARAENGGPPLYRPPGTTSLRRGGRRSWCQKQAGTA